MPDVEDENVAKPEVGHAELRILGIAFPSRQL
jgi:hypothetical protein